MVLFIYQNSIYTRFETCELTTSILWTSQILKCPYYYIRRVMLGYVMLALGVGWWLLWLFLVLSWPTLPGWWLVFGCFRIYTEHGIFVLLHSRESSCILHNLDVNNICCLKINYSKSTVLHSYIGDYNLRPRWINWLLCISVLLLTNFSRWKKALDYNWFGSS